MPLRQNGLSLIEVLVALVVFSVGLLGTARLLVQQNQLGQESGYRAMASIMAEDLLERIKLDASRAGRYLGAYEAQSEASTTEEEVPADLQDWAEAWLGRHALPSPRVCAERHEEVVVVTIAWRARSALTPPSDLPSCITARTTLPNQRWVSLHAWIGSE